MDELFFAKNLAREVGGMLMEHFGEEAQEKQKEGIGDVFTKADELADEIIVEAIKQEFPSHEILIEESGHHASIGFKEEKKDVFTWIVDPLDGSLNFAHKIPFFGVSIALAKNNQIILGVVYNPVTRDTFFAGKGTGAFLNEERIQVNQEPAQEELLSFAGTIRDKQLYAQVLEKLLKRFRLIKMLGAVSLELCFVACNRLNAVVRLQELPWDISAGCLIAEEAGAVVTDFSGNPWSINSQNIVAANKELHKQVIELLK